MAPPALAFEHGANTVRFAAGLSGPGAEAIVAELLAAMKQPAGAASA